MCVAMTVLMCGCYAGVDDSDFEAQRLRETDEIVENLELAGFPEWEIGVLQDGTVFVGSDAVVNLEASREMVEHLGDGDGDRFRQYRTNNLVDTNAVSTICINPTASFNSNANLSAGLDLAIARYNARALQFTMQRGGSGCDANITAVADNSGGGLAGFPSGGLPYGQVNIGNVVGTYGVGVASHVIGHELGHCIGFRHTDFFDRSISCGGFPQDEGSGGVGAVHIPGTPTTNVDINTSVMNSCFNGGSTGIWTSSDEIALEFLYGTGGVGGTVYDPIDTQTNLSGALDSEVFYGPYDASTYDAIRLSISGGTGDADLYVRFGAPPTTTTWDCRPFVGGNEETCEFNPSQSGDYYVMVQAYAAYSGLTLSVEAAGGGPPPPAEICDNGSDDDGDGDTDCADSDCAADPACAPVPEPEVCDDGTDNDLDGDPDCADADCSADPACAPPSGFTELFSNDFESGFGNFNDGGSDVRRSINDAAYASSGSYCVRLRDDSGSASATDSDPFDLSGYGELQIEFSFYARSMETGENFVVEVWSGSSWVIVANATSGTNFVNDQFYDATITVTDAQVSFSSQARVRFRNDASNNSDYVYIDDVVVSAQ